MSNFVPPKVPYDALSGHQILWGAAFVFAAISCVMYGLLIYYNPYADFHEVEWLVITWFTALIATIIAYFIAAWLWRTIGPDVGVHRYSVIVEELALERDGALLSGQQGIENKTAAADPVPISGSGGAYRFANGLANVAAAVLR